jgi:hypothetical protein
VITPFAGSEIAAQAVAETDGRGASRSSRAAAADGMSE